jgi:AbrB family looped-hinge helix DNA binding protein
MPTLTVSPKFQVVIPKEIRESLALQPGQKIQATLIDGRIQLVPVIPVRELRGFLPGLDPTVPREGDRL